MKFDLTPTNSPVILIPYETVHPEITTVRVAVLHVKLRSFRDQRPHLPQNKYKDMLIHALTQYSSLHQSEKKWPLEMIVFSRAEQPTGHLIIRDSDTNILFAALEQICGGVNNFTLDYHVQLRSQSGTSLEIQGKFPGQKVEQLSSQFASFTRLEGDFNFMPQIKQDWEGSLEFSCYLEMGLTLNGEALDMLHFGIFKDNLSIYKNLLTDDTLADAVIIAGNGTEFKCHRAFLSAHSPIFKTMIEGFVREGSPVKFALSEVSEACVRALLAYVYCWELKDAFESCSLALELILSAEKYKISKLSNRVRELIIPQHHDWFSVKVALKLLYLAWKIWDDFGLQRVACATLREKSIQELEECTDYREIFSKQPELGMELCKFFMKEL